MQYEITDTKKKNIGEQLAETAANDAESLDDKVFGELFTAEEKKLLAKIDANIETVKREGNGEEIASFNADMALLKKRAEEPKEDFFKSLPWGRLEIEKMKIREAKGEKPPKQVDFNFDDEVKNPPEKPAFIEKANAESAREAVRRFVENPTGTDIPDISALPEKEKGPADSAIRGALKKTDDILKPSFLKKSPEKNAVPPEVPLTPAVGSMEGIYTKESKYSAAEKSALSDFRGYLENPVGVFDMSRLPQAMRAQAEAELRRRGGDKPAEKKVADVVRTPLQEKIAERKKAAESSEWSIPEIGSLKDMRNIIDNKLREGGDAIEENGKTYTYNDILNPIGVLNHYLEKGPPPGAVFNVYEVVNALPEAHGIRATVEDYLEKRIPGFKTHESVMDIPEEIEKKESEEKREEEPLALHIHVPDIAMAGEAPQKESEPVSSGVHVFVPKHEDAPVAEEKKEEVMLSASELAVKRGGALAWEKEGERSEPTPDEKAEKIRALRAKIAEAEKNFKTPGFVGKDALEKDILMYEDEIRELEGSAPEKPQPEATPAAPAEEVKDKEGGEKTVEGKDGGGTEKEAQKAEASEDERVPEALSPEKEEPLTFTERLNAVRVLNLAGAEELEAASHAGGDALDAFLQKLNIEKMFSRKEIRDASAVFEAEEAYGKAYSKAGVSYKENQQVSFANFLKYDENLQKSGENWRVKLAELNATLEKETRELKEKEEGATKDGVEAYLGSMAANGFRRRLVMMNAAAYGRKAGREMAVVKEVFKRPALMKFEMLGSDKLPRIFRAALADEIVGPVGKALDILSYFAKPGFMKYKLDAFLEKRFLNGAYKKYAAATAKENAELEAGASKMLEGEYINYRDLLSLRAIDGIAEKNMAIGELLSKYFEKKGGLAERKYLRKRFVSNMLSDLGSGRLAPAMRNLLQMIAGGAQ
jgi:hypothetical protein